MSYSGEFRKLDHRKVEVAIICALTVESTAVEACFDEEFDSNRYNTAPSDDNSYRLARIGQHYIVLTYLPQSGKVNSAVAATRLRASFSNIRLGLLVGVCGSVPHRQEDGRKVEIMLGDVIISTGVVQYDLGRQYDTGRPIPRGTIHDSLGRYPHALSSFIHKCKAGIESGRLHTRLKQYVTDVYNRDGVESYKRPDTEDVLYPPEYLHKHRPPQDCVECHTSESQVCEGARLLKCEDLGCESDARIKRPLRPPSDPATSHQPNVRIHWGLIGSGDSVIKSGRRRDEIAKEEGVIAFEMEGSGVWDAFPTLIVKGVSDYADSHKHKNWQPFAATTAAAAAKALLMSWNSGVVIAEANDEASAPVSPVLQFCPTSSSNLSASTQLYSSSSGRSTWMVPFDRSVTFVGRCDKLDEVQKFLFKTDTDSCCKAAISGLGGIGKTRLCIEVAYHSKENFPDRSVFWIQCSDVASFERDCRRLAEKLDLPGARDPSKDFKILMKEYLDKDDIAKWLLILDGADDESLWSANARAQNTAALIHHVPRGRSGAVLFTTRNHKIAYDVAQKNTIGLDSLSLEESQSMLQNLLVNPLSGTDDRANADLLKHLTYLPLAIIQAAAYMNQHQMKVCDYLRVWDSDLEEDKIELLSAEFTDDSRPSNAHNAVARTWLISFKAIERENSHARVMLSYLSCLHYQAILKSTIPSVHDSYLVREKAFGLLQNYAFLQAQTHGTSETIYDMHRLVHLVSRNHLRQYGGLSDNLHIVAEHLRTLIPERGIDDNPGWYRHLPHIEYMVSTTDVQDVACSFELPELLARAYYADGAYTKSLNHRQALARKLHGSAPPEDNSHRIMKNSAALAEILRQMGRGEESIASAEQAFNLSENDSVQFYDKVSVMECLARTYGAFGDQERALELSKDTVQRARTCDYPNDALKTRTIMSALQNLSLRYESLRQYHDEKKTLEEIVELAKTLNSEIDKAQSEMALATAYSRLNRGDEAISILTRVRDLFERKLRPGHRLTLNSISHLAEIYYGDGQSSVAEHLYKYLLRQYAIAGRRDDAKLLADRIKFAHMLFEQGRFKEAKDIQSITLELTKTATGEDSAITLKSMEALACTHWELGERNAAIAMIYRCYESSMTASTLGALHPDTVDRLWLKMVWDIHIQWDYPD